MRPNGGSMKSRAARRCVAFLPLVFLLAACVTNAPQDALKPEGPVARQEHNLFVPVFWIAAAIFFLVEGLIVFAAIKFRDRPGRTDPTQIHGNTRLEFAWTLAPAILLLGIAIPTVLTIFDISDTAAPDAVRVRVVGHQWWWEYHYENTDPAVVTANELVIPINRPVFLELESADVIHSFWVPRLAGKQDVVPDRVNTLQFVAERPNQSYYGQCAEFCSISHANMRLRVITKTESDFQAWLRGQQDDAVEPTDALAQRGKALFLSNACVNCHAIAGTDAAGQQGPNLTHFGSRTTLGAAMFSSTEGNLFEWIKHARDRKPGVLMPNFDRLPSKGDVGGAGVRVLSDDEIRAIVAYLRSLL